MTMTDRASPGVDHVRAGGGSASWVVGDTYTTKATAESTGGAFSLLEASIPPGGGPPPHLHTNEDEAFYLLNGVLEISAGDETTLARAGDFVYLPRGIVHWFTNPGVDAARTLIIVAPAGFERYFQEIGMPASPGEQAPPFDAADLQRHAETSRTYGIQIDPPTSASTI
jgi:quercetin dioxygenase-like cupin family protein